jgi:hypothetical protein
MQINPTVGSYLVRGNGFRTAVTTTPWLQDRQSSPSDRQHMICVAILNVVLNDAEKNTSYVRLRIFYQRLETKNAIS